MNGESVRVLSIEDHPGDARLIEEKLAQAEMMGLGLPAFDVSSVGSMEAALAYLHGMATGRTPPVDVVLTDLDLPDSEASETFATLRRHFPDMPIVVLTGREDENLARTTIRAGAQDYLFKNEATGSFLAHALIYAIERQENARALQRTHAQIERRVEQALEEQARALQDSERRLDRILQTMVDGLVVVNLEGEITYANPAAERILEVQRDEIVGRYYSEREW
jgi:DNA-binding NarL/FixJ family response regulator